MFKNLFATKKVEKVVRVKLEVKKLQKVTQLLLPDDFILDKNSKVVLTQLEDTNEIVLTKLVPEMGELIAKKAFDYNSTNHSVNSQVLADKLRELFDIDEVEFSLNTEVKIIEGVTVLILTSGKIDYNEEETVENSLL